MLARRSTPNVTYRPPLCTQRIFECCRIANAGLPERRLHDARHTAATVLAILAVPTPTAMAMMGWSSGEMAARYQHVLDSIRKSVADQVGGLLWGTDDDYGPTDRDG